MICANCIHYESCLSWIKHGSMLYDDFDYSVENCPYFKDKSDFKEIVHGEWEKYKKHKPMCKEIYSVVFRCSVCHGFSFHNGEMRKHYKFCPNCGADMRGEKK